MMSAGNRCPFTAIQWQELEHQALIFKYLVSGVPVPPELVCSVKRSLEYPSSVASRLFPHQPIGWGYFQMGFGKKADPEPGRCRRTDGKKWRCSKEAYPDSKYCERHMHRGRNRSRKPVEATNISSSSSSSSTITPPPPPPPRPPSSSSLSIKRNFSIPTTTTTVSSSSSSPPLSLSTTSGLYSHSPNDPNNPSHLNPLLYSYSSSSRILPSDSDSSLQNNTAHHNFLDFGSSQADKDFRYFHGMREGMDEKSLFPEASGSVRNLNNSHQQGQHQPWTTTSYKGYSPQEPLIQYLQTLAYNNPSNQLQNQDQQQHCFVLGADIKSQIKAEKEEQNESKKPLHHFFDEWPPN